MSDDRDLIIDSLLGELTAARERIEMLEFTVRSNAVMAQAQADRELGYAVQTTQDLAAFIRRAGMYQAALDFVVSGQARRDRK